jgi:ACT domain-containing protein
MDIKMQKWVNQYNQVNDLYVNQNYSMQKACKQVGICKKTYYNISKKINNQSGGNSENKISSNNIETNNGNNNNSDQFRTILAKIEKCKNEVKQRKLARENNDD